LGTLAGSRNSPAQTAAPSGELSSERFIAALLANADGQNARAELGEATFQEILSLAQEPDPTLMATGLLRVAQRLLDRGQLDWALKIEEGLRSGAKDPALAQKAEARAQAILGQGAGGARFEFLLQRLAKDATDYKTILPMMAGSFVGQLAETAVLGRLAGTARSGWLASRWAPRVIAAGSGYVPEFLTFGLLNRAMERKPEGSLLEELERSALSIGALKAMGFLGNQAFLRFHGFGAQGLPTRLLGLAKADQILMPQLSIFSGLLLSHQLEERWGLRRKTDGATFAMDTLASMLSLSVGAHLGQAVLGPRFAGMQQELGFRAGIYGAQVATGPESVDLRDFLPAALASNQGMKGLKTEILMMGMGDSGGGGGVPTAESEAREFTKLQVAALRLLEKVESGDLRAEARLHRLDLKFLAARALDGYPEAIELLESLYLAGHPEALQPLCEAVPSYALSEIRLAQSGDRNSKLLVTRMNLDILLNAAEEPQDLDHRMALQSLVYLAVLGRQDAEEALQNLFEYQPSVAIELVRLAEARPVLRHFSLHALASAAQDSSQPLHGKAAHALVRLLEEEGMGSELTLALAEAWVRSPDVLRVAFHSQPDWHLQLFERAREGDKAACFLLLAVAGRNSELRERLQVGLRKWGIASIPTLEQVRDPSLVLVKEKAGAGDQDSEGDSWPLDREGVTLLGRGPGGENFLVLPDRRISRNQAAITKRGSHYWIRSLADETKAFSPQQGVWLETNPGLWRKLPPNSDYALASEGRIAFGLLNEQQGREEAAVFRWREGKLISEGNLADAAAKNGPATRPPISR